MTNASRNGRRPRPAYTAGLPARRERLIAEVSEAQRRVLRHGTTVSYTEMSEINFKPTIRTIAQIGEHVLPRSKRRGSLLTVR